MAVRTRRWASSTPTSFRKGLWLSLLLVLSLASLVPGDPTHAAVDWPQLAATQVVAGLKSPTFVGSAGDGTNRLFVVEKPGRIRIVKNGALNPAPFLDITSRVLSSGAEQGLFSLAFPPGYASKGYFYVDYTAPGIGPAGHTVVSRFHVTGADAADPNSEEVLFTIAQPYANHNGGQLQFGPDGALYIGMGDGGSGGDPQNHAQNPSDPLGKLLRMDVEGGATSYTMWAYGLRNPWRFSFDRATGDLYIADVGQDRYEEVDYAPAGDKGGENYGWHVMEGLHCYDPATNCDQTGLTEPVVEYTHDLGCSITGGYVYRGPGNPRMQGMYFYSDYCSGRIWGLKQDGGVWQSSDLLDTNLNVSSFGQDEAGCLYFTDITGGAVYRLDEGAAPTAVPNASANRLRLPTVSQPTACAV